MLMLRPSPLARLQEYDRDLDPDLFSAMDVTPACILALIEVKGLELDRALLFTAIAEAAANSRWANEAWLVFVDWKEEKRALDSDVVSLARSVEVGLLEVQLASEAQTMQVVVHHAAPTRPTLRVGELTQDRVGVLRAAQELLREWQSGSATFLDIDFPQHKLRVLIH